MLPSRHFDVFCSLFFLGCSAEPTQGVGPEPQRGVDVVALADGKSITVTAQVVDDHAQPIPLSDGVFAAEIDGTEYVLVLASDDRGDPIYRAVTPAHLSYVDVTIRHHHRAGDSYGDPIAQLRVSAPFSVTDAPTTLRVGDELDIALSHANVSLSGNAKISFEGSCLAPTAPAALQTYGGYEGARFDTTSLPIEGSCPVEVAVSFVDERSVSSSYFERELSSARGLQERTFTVQVSR